MMEKTSAIQVFDRLQAVVGKKMEYVINTQSETLNEVAIQMDQVIRNDGIIHLFGSGHSHLIAEDCLYRAGCFAPANPILPEEVIIGCGAVMATRKEREHGLAERVFHQYCVSKNDMMIVISNSGINDVPIEMAQLSKDHGILVACITSMAHSKRAETRSASHKKLFQICDYSIDNGCDYGDASIELENGVRVAPVSTIMGSFILQGLFASVAEIMLQRGEKPPVYESANITDGAANNQHLIDRYIGRVKHL